MKLGLFYFFSVCVHSILFFSVFDIYFTSPIIHGVNQVQPENSSPASRLVLFVADGLRADKFYEADETTRIYRNPYLRSLIKSGKSSWGVSHTRMPTESRPGHVALIAGFYEDVSAITKGWKENPVEFDSVFNQSRITFSWGSPDILPMFAKGATGNHVYTSSYPAEFESFDGNADYLDDWVFDKVHKFFVDARKNETLNSQLRQDKVVFFLHLLGIDTNGHAFNPTSLEYLNNIKSVDAGVRKIVQLFDEFYNDSKTAYIFTADHGMTDWGSHGAGLPSETLTPLVAWGSGVATNANCGGKLTSQEILQTETWGLSPNQRCDVNQADVAPLMSSLAGIPVPVNSVGVLPVDYVSDDDITKAQLLLSNARQISAQYVASFSQAKQKSIFFKQFGPLPPSEVIDLQRKARDQILMGNGAESLALSQLLIKLSLEGLNNYHTYHRTLLYCSITASYLGWIAVTMVMLVRQSKLIIEQTYRNKQLKPTRLDKLVLLMIKLAAIFTFIGLWWIDVKFSYYIYCLLPYVIWFFVFKQRFCLVEAASITLYMPGLLKSVSLCAFVSVIGIFCLVASFFYRWFLTLMLLCSTLTFKNRNWFVICVVISLFPLLPTVGRSPDMRLVVFGGIVGALFSLQCFNKFLLKVRMSPKSATFWVVCFPFLCSLIRPFSMVFHQVPVMVHVVSWCTLVASWVLPSMYESHHRLPSLLTCHMSFYMLTCLSYDALFIALFCYLIHQWITCENLQAKKVKEEQFKLVENADEKIQNYLQAESEDINSVISASKHRSYVVQTVRRSFVFIFLLVLAFFGVGNIASINSFDVKVVLPFVTVFSPFVMGPLLAYKVLLPNLLVASSLYNITLTNKSKSQINQLCFLTLIYSDLMALCFFFLVQDHGSWLDIGTSISHYVIVCTMTLSLLVFINAARFMMTHKV